MELDFQQTKIKENWEQIVKMLLHFAKVGFVNFSKNENKNSKFGSTDVLDFQQQKIGIWKQ